MIARARARRAWRRFLPAVLVVLGGLPAAAAPPINAGGGKDQPITITADHGIEWQKDAQVYVARGDAVATRGRSQVRADTLIAHYRPKKGAEGDTEIYRLDADGHVTIVSGGDTVVGDQAVYDVAQGIAVVTGKGLKLTTPTDVVTARDSLEWYDEKQIAVARGDAYALRGDKRLRADILTAHMIKEKPAAGAQKGAAAAPAQLPKPPPAAAGAKKGAAAALDTGEENSRISRIDAQGNVVVSTATDVGRGDYGVYNALTGIVTLLGNVTITRGDNVLRGQYAVVDLNTNISRIMTLAAKPGQKRQQVEGVFVRQDAANAAAGRSGTSGPAAAAGKKP